jgi:hypothetical protein
MGSGTGVGFTETQIEYLPSLLMPRPIEYYSLFISYAHQDEILAQRLYTHLRQKDVPCWFAPEDMKIGDRIRPRIDEAIRLHDKLLLVLSASSVASEWVEYEVETALARERKEKRIVLFPIRLDNAVMESSTAWAAHIQHTRHIGDFTRWKNHDEYQQAFARLLRDLNAEAKKTEEP